jgi:hypothetical protein
MDWNAAADAFIKVWREVGQFAATALIAAGLLWKALDSWGKRKKD